MPIKGGGGAKVKPMGKREAFCQDPGQQAASMAGRGVWGRVRERLQRFPESLASCGEQASAYGKCVASHASGQVDLRKDVCAKEFEMLMDCFTKAVKKNVK